MIASPHASSLGLRVPLAVLLEALEKANRFLVDLPTAFELISDQFYAILNQRNVSGFVGEVLKHSITSVDGTFAPNPHPDGRPDLLEISNPAVADYLRSQCVDKQTGAPHRAKLAPFHYGGIEIKATIGNARNASDRLVGQPRVAEVTGLNYWSHHIHGCDLLAIYYDFALEHKGNPQIKAAFYLTIMEQDWHKVSTGNPAKKKTSNTSLTAAGIRHLYKSLVAYDDSKAYKEMLARIGVTL